MSFDYQILNLHALIANPINISKENLEKGLAMKKYLLEKISSKEIKYILVNNKKFLLIETDFE